MSYCIVPTRRDDLWAGEDEGSYCLSLETPPPAGDTAAPPPLLIMMDGDTTSDLDRFFQGCALALSSHHHQNARDPRRSRHGRGGGGGGMNEIVIVLRSAKELVAKRGRSYSFLEALVKFVSSHKFHWAGGNAEGTPVKLYVVLRTTIRRLAAVHHRSAMAAQEEEEEEEDDDDDIYREATSQICEAFWTSCLRHNVRHVGLYLPFVPCQKVVNDLVAWHDRGRGDDGGDNENEADFVRPRATPFEPPITLRATMVVRQDDDSATVADIGVAEAHPLAADADAAAAAVDILHVEVVGAVILTAVGGMDAVTTLMDRVMNVFQPNNNYGWRRHRRATFYIASERVADAVAACLHRYRTRTTTSLETIRFKVGSSPNIAAVTHRNVQRFRNRQTLDGIQLFRAALSIDSVANVAFDGFRLSGDMLLLASLPPRSGGAVPLRSLVLRDVTFVDSIPDLGAFVSAHSPSLENLDLRGTPLPLPTIVGLCRALERSPDINCRLRYLHFGRSLLFVGTCLCDDSVAHFFRNLPAMKCLRAVTLCQHVPQTLSRIVVDGVKNNYGLEQLFGLTFEGDREDIRAVSLGLGPLMAELQSYLGANAAGRRAAVHDAVVALNEADSSAPDTAGHFLQDRKAKVESALRVLEHLSSDADDCTSRFLCVRLFLPAVLSGGGGGINDKGRERSGGCRASSNEAEKNRLRACAHTVPRLVAVDEEPFAVITACSL